MSSKTICLDFDGVCHRYSQGWHDGTCYDVPVAGAFEFIREKLKTHAVCVLTTRDVDLVKAYFTKHAGDIPTKADAFPKNIFWNSNSTVLITNRKIAAECYIDDRAIRFRRNWNKVEIAMGECSWVESDAVALLYNSGAGAAFAPPAVP